MLIESTLEQDSKGDVVLKLSSSSTAIKLFGKPGTGFILRSPSGILDFLGELVSIEARGDWTPKLTSPDGESVPIFDVRRGAAAGRAVVTAVVDREHYWIPKRKLGQGISDFSVNSLAILKEFNTLSTQPEQIPTASQILVGN